VTVVILYTANFGSVTVVKGQKNKNMPTSRRQRKKASQAVQEFEQLPLTLPGDTYDHGWCHPLRHWLHALTLYFVKDPWRPVQAVPVIVLVVERPHPYRRYMPTLALSTLALALGYYFFR
jgi:hypothetical protein